MTRVQAAPPEHFTWLTERTRYRPASDFRAIEAVDEAGTIAGLVGFDHWNPNSAQIHVALDRPALCRNLIRAAFEFPFLQAGRGVLIALVAEMNSKSLNLAKRFGFTVAHRVADGWASGVDLLVMELRKENCRWIRPQTEAA